MEVTEVKQQNWLYWVFAVAVGFALGKWGGRLFGQKAS